MTNYEIMCYLAILILGINFGFELCLINDYNLIMTTNPCSYVSETSFSSLHILYL